MIKIYSTTWCGYCRMAKNYFDHLGLQYQEINVENDPEKAQEMVDKSGQMGVPVIDIDGSIVVGFDKTTIDHLILQKSAK